MSRRLRCGLGRVLIQTRRRGAYVFCYSCIVVTLRRATVVRRRISSVQANLSELRWRFVVSSNGIVFVVR